MNLAEFSIRNRLIVWIVIVASLATGWLAYQNMPRFEDPEFTIRTAQIFTQYPGASPIEVAEEVSDELETAIQQMQEVDEIRSTSSDGLSLLSVDIKFEYSPTKSDLDLVWTKLRNRMADAASNLPPGAEAPVVNDDFGDVYGLYYTLTGPGFTAAELQSYAETLRTNLLAVDGVAKVQIGGTQTEAVFVEISREKASAFGLSVRQIFADLAEQNSVISAGTLVFDGQRLVIDPSGEVDSVTALENVVVSTPEAGTTIRLGEIAEITQGYIDPPRFLQRFNGEPSLSLGVSNLPGTNVVELGERIETAMEASLGQRPYGIEVHEFYNQAKAVDAAVRAFAINVVSALVIVLITLLVFMGPRAAAVIGAALLLTISATLGTMWIVDVPMHRISLGALIIALGMLVDNAIVVTEGMMTGDGKSRSMLDTAKTIVSRTQWPLLGGTLVGILAFAPIGFAPGSTAEFTGDLFWVILISLLYSWVFAITLVPFLGNMLLKSPDPDQGPAKDRVFTRVYKAFMRFLLHVRWLVVGAAVAAFAASVWAFQFVVPGFFPASTTPQIVVDYWLPQGTDITNLDRDLDQIETELMDFEGIESLHTLVGGGTLRYMLVYNSEPNNSSYGQILIRTESYEQVERLLPRIQAHLDLQYPQAQAKVWRFQMGPGGGSKIEAQFLGSDPTVLRRLADEAKAIMASEPGAILVKDDWRQPVPVVTPVYNANIGRRLGISREDLANAIRANYAGDTIGVYREGDDLLPIVSRAPESERLSPESLVSLQIASPATGLTVPLIEIVSDVRTEWRDALLLRVDRVWAIQAQCDPAEGILTGDLLQRLRPQIDAIELPPGYSLVWQGEAGDSAEAQQNLAATIPLGFLAMVLTVVLLFNAVRQPLLIWLTVPLALIGVVIGLLVTGLPMEFMAILGVLSLSGLLIKNAIVLVDQTDLEIGEGKPRHDAVVDSAASRVRPVMMGSMTTVFGLIPLLADAFFQSMAVVLVFGLSFATLLTLLVVPILYALFFGIKSSERAIS